MHTVIDISPAVEPTSPADKIALGQIEDLLGRLLRAAKVGFPQRAGLQALQGLLQTLLKPPRAPKAPTPSTAILEGLQTRFETQVSEAVDVISRLETLHARYTAAFSELKTKARREVEVDLAWNAHSHEHEHPVHAAE